MEAILTARQMRRLRRRVIARKRNEPPVLTAGEEVFNAVSHGLGAVLAAVAAVLLLVRSDTGLKVMASCFYGVSMFLMMLMSNEHPHEVGTQIFTEQKPSGIGKTLVEDEKLGGIVDIEERVV